MKKRVVSVLIATIMTVTAGAFAPAVTASVTISDSNVTTFTNKLEKSGTGTVSGVSGTEKTIGSYECYSDYTVSMTTNSGYAYIKDNSIQSIKADSFGWAHFKLAISSTSNFVLKFDVQYTNSSGSNKTVTVFNMKDHSLVGGTQQNPKDYTADILFDLAGKKAYVYLNGIKKDEAIETDIADISYLRQLRFANNAGVAHSYTVSGLLLEAYPKGATLGDVLGYLTDSDAPIDFEKGTYFEGINAISTSDAISHGSMHIKENSSSVTGDNTEGYVLADTAAGGFYRYFLFDNKDGNGNGMPNQTKDSVVRHSFLVCPTAGNKTISVGKYSTKDELTLLYFDEQSKEVRDKDGNKVADYDKNNFYQVDFFFNNYDYEYSVYLDGMEVSGGTLENTPVGYISYINGASGSSMTLKNIFTKVYALGTSMNTVIGELYGTAYIELQDFTVLETENGSYEISAAAVFNNISKNYQNPKLVYALYKNGELLNAGGNDITEEIAVTQDDLSLEYSGIGRKYPYGLLKTDGVTVAGGDVLIVKAWLISEGVGTHLIDSNEVSFTAE